MTCEVSTMLIRPARENDAERIAEIYNDAVLNTTAIWIISTGLRGCVPGMMQGFLSLWR